VSTEPVYRWRFRAKWIPVRAKKTRQNKNLKPGSDSTGIDETLVDMQQPNPIQPQQAEFLSDSIGTEKALDFS
jgi:hypothetical protein